MKRVVAFLCLALFSLLASAATTVISSILSSETKGVDVDTPWDGHLFRDQATISVSGTDSGFTYCRHVVDERSRNPRDQLPSEDHSGYRLVSVSDTSLTWQWWVMPWKRALDQRRHWLNVNFTVFWIRTTATADERKTAGCVSLPKPEPVREWPPETATPAGPPVRAEFFTVLRAWCERRDGTPTSNVYYEKEGVSNSSCADARKTARLSFEGEPDRCLEFRPANAYRYSGRTEWVSTARCP